MTIGEKLRAARDRRGLTQQDVAERLGVSQPTVHSWESGETTPRVTRLRLVADVYGVRVSDLIPEAA